MQDISFWAYTILIGAGVIWTIIWFFANYMEG